MLASKISCLLVVSLAFLLGALLVMPSQGHPWQDFIMKHIDSSTQYPPTNNDVYCNVQMLRRRMTRPDCKSFNTFIFAPETTVQQICHNIMGPIQTTSTVTFNLINCVYISGNPSRNCKYVGIPFNKQIVVTCEYHLPVHYNWYV